MALSQQGWVTLPSPAAHASDLTSHVKIFVLFTWHGIFSMRHQIKKRLLEYIILTQFLVFDSDLNNKVWVWVILYIDMNILSNQISLLYLFL